MVFPRCLLTGISWHLGRPRGQAGYRATVVQVYVRLVAREVIMGSWGNLFYAQHHQQSLEIGTSIASCQSLHTVGNTHLLNVNIHYNYKHSRCIHTLVMVTHRTNSH